MRLLETVILVIAAVAHPGNCAAESGAVIRAEPQPAFCSRAVWIPVTIENPQPVPFDADIRLQLFQLSSSTTAPVSQFSWKRIRVLPRQTLCDAVPITFPEIRSETRFLIDWIANNQILGRATVAVFPTNLLAELKLISNGKPVEILDLENELQPILALNGVPCSNLKEKGLEAATGPLVIVAQSEIQSAGRVLLGSRIQALSKRGIAVVWIRPATEIRDKLVPSFYIVTNQPGTVVVAQPDLVANLSENPRAQWNLIRLARMAVHPEPFQLPELGTTSVDSK